MNSLSWMIYLAEVCGSLSVAFGLVGILGGIGLAITATVLAVEDGMEGLAVIRWPAMIVAMALFVSCLLPSKTTVYAIAASEMGEQVINTPTAGKAIKALDAWLDRQIAGKPEPKE